jgi:AhpC/TSA family protein
MVNRGRRALIQVLLGAGLAACLVVVLPSRGAAVEEGALAPDFKLPATTGLDIALSDFKGKKWVLLEFYGADFSPT